MSLEPTVIDKLKKRIDVWRHFFYKEIWQMELSRLSRFRRFVIHLCKVVFIVIRGFILDKCILQAAALTFITLMSIVPLMAMLLATAKGLGSNQNIVDWLQDNLSNFPPEIKSWILELIKMSNENINLVTIGAVGIFFMLVTVISVMSKFESCMNSIWGVGVNRKFTRRLVDFGCVLFVVPLLLLFVTSLNASMVNQDLQVLVKERIGIFYFLYDLVLRLTGLLSIVLALFFLYTFMPNVKVKFKSAITGAIVAGILWILWQKFCINFQFWLTKYNQMYGAFASLPVVLYWLNINWVIILLGTEICFAMQNLKTYVYEQESDNMSYRVKMLICYRLIYDICDSFKYNKSNWTALKFQKEYHIPIRLINEMTSLLVKERLIHETKNGEFVPAKELHQMTLLNINNALYGKVIDVYKDMTKLPEDLEKFIEENDAVFSESLKSKSFSELT